MRSSRSWARLIQFFLRFLDAAGIPRTDLTFRVFIHANADVESARRFWLEVTGAPPGYRKIEGWAAASMTGRYAQTE